MSLLFSIHGYSHFLLNVHHSHLHSILIRFIVLIISYQVHYPFRQDRLIARDRLSTMILCWWRLHEIQVRAFPVSQTVANSQHMGFQ